MRRQKIAHRCAILWGKTIFLLIPGWTTRVIHRHLLPSTKKEKFIMVANHESNADVFALYALGIQFRWIGKKSAFKIPVFGWAGSACGYIPIERGDQNSHHQALEESAKMVAAGVPMFFFPEGTRSKTGEVKDFKLGAFRIAQTEGAFIVPICISNTRKLLKKGSILPGNAEVTLEVMPPFKIGENEDLSEVAARTRQMIVNAKSGRDHA